MINTSKPQEDGYTEYINSNHNVSECKIENLEPKITPCKLGEGGFAFVSLQKCKEKKPEGSYIKFNCNNNELYAIKYLKKKADYNDEMNIIENCIKVILMMKM